MRFGLLLLFLIASTGSTSADWTFVRGDASGDGTLDLSDPILIASHLDFGTALACQAACDADDSGDVGLDDVLFLLGFLYTNGARPTAPFPQCGVDMTPDGLGCDGPVQSCQEVAPLSMFPGEKWKSTSFAGTVQGVAAGDLNGDGYVDVVTANSASDDFNVFLGRARVGFHPPLASSITGFQPDAVELDDLNGDGNLDVMLWSCNESEVHVRLGSASSVLQGGSVEVDLGYEVEDLAIGDFNGDGIPDLVAVEEGNVRVHAGAGDGTFELLSTRLGGDSRLAIAVADMDGDGDLDVVTSNASGTVSVYFGEREGTLSAPMDFAAVSVAASNLVIADFDNDGLADVVVVPEQTASVSLLLGAGGGALSPPLTHPLPGWSFIPEMECADLDLDGNMDLLVSTAADRVALLRGVGGGSFEEAEVHLVSHNCRDLALADVTSDGVLDLLSAGSTGSDIGVLRGVPGGTFRSSTNSLPGVEYYDVSVADFDEDSVSDLVLVGTDQMVSIACGDGQGGFEIASATFVDNVTWVTHAFLDGDAQPDVVAVPSSNALAYTFLGDGDGGLISAEVVFTVSSSDRVVSSDVNGDGAADVLVASNSDGVSVMLGDGLGGLLEAPPVNPDEGAMDVAVADLDLDGDTDFVGLRTNGPWAALNNGDGTFVFGPGLGTGTFAWSVALGELDGDGIPDLWVAGSDEFNTRLGLGDGTFGPIVEYPSSGASRRLILADLNLDGTVDAVSVSFANHEVAVRLNNGDGSLSEARYYAATLGNSLGVADLDGDGDLDLVAVGDGVTVLFNSTIP